jgi:hypothetical protein
MVNMNNGLDAEAKLFRSTAVTLPYPKTKYVCMKSIGAKPMKTLVTALIALTLMGPATLAFADEVEAKACKSGKILDPDTGKCVTPRGS